MAVKKSAELLLFDVKKRAGDTADGLADNAYTRLENSVVGRYFGLKDTRTTDEKNSHAAALERYLVLWPAFLVFGVLHRGTSSCNSNA